MQTKGMIVIEDDAQCKAVLAYHGRLQALAPRTDCPRVFILFADESMAYIAAHWYGYTDPQDNGYMLYILPKIHFSKSDVIAWWKRITQSDEPEHKVVFQGFVQCWPQNN